MSRDIDRPVFYSCARRVLAKKVVTLPVPRLPDGSGNEAATTVWTDIVQHMLDAGGTERTFIGADACLSELGGSTLLQCSQVGLSSSIAVPCMWNSARQKSAATKATAKSEAFPSLRWR